MLNEIIEDLAKARMKVAAIRENYSRELERAELDICAIENKLQDEVNLMLNNQAATHKAA